MSGGATAAIVISQQTIKGSGTPNLGIVSVVVLLASIVMVYFYYKLIKKGQIND